MTDKQVNRQTDRLTDRRTDIHGVRLRTYRSKKNLVEAFRDPVAVRRPEDLPSFSSGAAGPQQTKQPVYCGLALIAYSAAVALNELVSPMRLLSQIVWR